ncbi:MAG: hypothetical protein IKW76_13500 [Clostridia bacterium]|nr:hypothetical protein [Clostridia bacterium]
MKRIRIPAEIIYVLAILMLSFSVAMAACTDFGISMIAAPALILSEKLPLTFGQCEYIVQGLLFAVFCILMKKVRLVYFSSFLTGLIYGAALDLWRVLIPHFNPDVTAPGVLPMWLRIVYFVLSMVLCSFSIALFFHTYLYPQIYDFFVKGVSAHYHLNRTRFKQCFDASCLLVSCILTLTLFRRFVGIGVGTLIITLCNGWLIGKFSDLFDKALTAEPLFPRFAAHFDLER